MTATAISAPLGWGQILLLLSGRFLFNTAFRIVYPLLAFLAAGFEVDLVTASLIISIQVGATLISPLGGILADTRGDRTTMAYGLVIFCIGAMLCAATRNFNLFLLGYGLIGFGTALYLPSSQAYASARSAYAQRGRVLAILELSWALAAIVGVTIVAWISERSGTPAPAFWLFAALGASLLLLILLLLPGATRGLSKPVVQREASRLRLLLLPRVFGTLSMTFCVLLGVELIFVIYAGWLEQDFRASTSQLAQVFSWFGFTELGGSLGSALLTDRLGKRRSVVLGYAGTGIFLLLLPLSTGNWLLFIPIFLAFGLCFEFGIVSSFSLTSGLVPSARGTLLSLSVATVGLARLLGSLVATPLWQSSSFTTNALLGGILSLGGTAICLLLVREGEQ